MLKKGLLHTDRCKHRTQHGHGGGVRKQGLEGWELGAEI